MVDLEKLIDRLGGVEMPDKGGDNLAIVLCGCYDNPDQEIDDDTGWTPDAVTGCDDALAAIRAHFQPAVDAANEAADTIATLRAEVERKDAALAWYAYSDNYLEGMWVTSAVRADKGNRARAALGGADGKYVPDGNTPFAQGDRFIETIHERTARGEWIKVKHHPNGDWSVAATAEKD